MEKRVLSEAWIQLEPQLAIVESYWAHLPPPEESWIDQGVGWIRHVIRDRPWTKWDATDWQLAMGLAVLGFMIVGNFAAMIGEVRRASAVR